ncbi:hypothetical protein MVEN_00185800 [Mycena venus]|uniref:Uncharacterized protein n=1 Tax=Mycena venus TaxID=2733690 RepID=A0A8H7DAS3_9AGAR|nr:hypothetical protein MVEN_00185800 [Mycena venus]
MADGKGPFVDYPLQHAIDTDADEALVHAYASFREQPTVAFPANARRADSWTLCVAIRVPEDSPTLLAVDYLIQYATTADSGNATAQTDVMLTNGELPEGVVSPLAVYTVPAQGCSAWLIGIRPSLLPTRSPLNATSEGSSGDTMSTPSTSRRM